MYRNLISRLFARIRRQQTINQVLTPFYEKQFSKNSFGFRQRRGCRDALRKAQSIITDGYKYVVDFDLESFFDTVSHSKLIEVLFRTIKTGGLYC